MICKVRETINKYNMPVFGRTVAVALSGGADSMTLLSVLNILSEELSIKLIACHVNHGIRGEQADADENFVREFCKKNGIECRVLKADIPKLAKEQGLGIEECGRKVRYDFFNSICDDVIVATAHTLSDRCETLLLNEVRGTSVKGLCSIPAVRGNIVRPLIECTRSEIEKYCAENKIEFVTDKTNYDTKYSRNRIRINVIPQLKELNPLVEKSFERLIESAQDDENYFSSIIPQLVESSRTPDGFNASDFINQHTAVRRRMLYYLLQNEADITPELVHIKMVEKILSGGTTEIIEDTVVKSENGKILINPIKEDTSEWQYCFDSSGTDLPNGKIYADIFNRNELPSTQIVHNKVIDFESIIGDIVVRNRRAGDSIKIAGSSCTKILKKLFNEKHLKNRSQLCILEDEKGIAWVEGLGCSDRCKITDKTNTVMVIRRGRKI